MKYLLASAGCDASFLARSKNLKSWEIYSGKEPSHWAACEYWLVSADATAWRDALTKTLSDPRCRCVCIFNWENLAAFPGIAKGIHEVLDGGQKYVML